MNNKNRKIIYVATLAVLAAAVVAAIVINYLPDLVIVNGDEVVDGLIKDLLVRVTAFVFLTYYIFPTSERSVLYFGLVGGWKSVVKCLPCLLVPLVNIPFSALFSGSAYILRTDVALWLFILDCLAIAAFEELFFRGTLQKALFEKIGNKPNGIIKTTIITSVFFGLFHLLNIVSGAGIGETLLQVVYTFLFGAMLSFVMFTTENLWMCVLLHAVFNFGGALVPRLGGGLFQDGVFWALTISVGVAVGVYVFVCFLKMQKKATKESS